MRIGGETQDWSTELMFAVLDILRNSDDPWAEGAVIMLETDIKLRSFRHAGTGRPPKERKPRRLYPKRGVEDGY